MHRVLVVLIGCLLLLAGCEWRDTSSVEQPAVSKQENVDGSSIPAGESDRVALDIGKTPIAESASQRVLYEPDLSLPKVRSDHMWTTSPDAQLLMMAAYNALERDSEAARQLFTELRDKYPGHYFDDEVSTIAAYSMLAQQALDRLDCERERGNKLFESRELLLNELKRSILAEDYASLEALFRCALDPMMAPARQVREIRRFPASFDWDKVWIDRNSYSQWLEANPAGRPGSHDIEEVMTRPAIIVYMKSSYGKAYVSGFRVAYVANGLVLDEFIYPRQF